MAPATASGTGSSGRAPAGRADGTGSAAGGTPCTAPQGPATGPQPPQPLCAPPGQPNLPQPHTSASVPASAIPHPLSFLCCCRVNDELPNLGLSVLSQSRLHPKSQPWLSHQSTSSVWCVQPAGEGDAGAEPGAHSWHSPLLVCLHPSCVMDMVGLGRAVWDLETSHTTSTRLRGKLGTSKMLRRSSKPLSAELGEEKCSRAISAAEHPPG